MYYTSPVMSQYHAWWSLVLFFILKLYVASTFTYMDDQQKYQMNFSVPVSLRSKTMPFSKFAQNKAGHNERILINSGTSSLGPHSNSLSLFDIFPQGTYIYIYKTIQFYISKSIFLL